MIMQKEIPKITLRGIKRRKAILRAAWKIFSENGYERTSMDAVLSLCGGSKTSLYRYFDSKEVLFKVATYTRCTELSKNIFQPFEEGADFYQSLYDFCYRYLTHNPDYIEVNRLASSEGRKINLGIQLFEKNFKVNWEKISTYIEHSVDQKSLLEGGGWTAAMHLKGLLDSEIFILRTWGVVDQIAPEEIEIRIRNSIRAFMRIYPLSRDIPVRKVKPSCQEDNGRHRKSRHRGIQKRNSNEGMDT